VALTDVQIHVGENIPTMLLESIRYASLLLSIDHHARLTPQSLVEKARQFDADIEERVNGCRAQVQTHLVELVEQLLEHVRQVEGSAILTILSRTQEVGE
jgi:hypothetical protein